MPSTNNPSDETGFDVDTSLLIVVGAHPRAELHDRPAAYWLCERITQALGAPEAASRAALQPLVVSDLWYLNDASLRARATISIGAPGVNALTAYLADKLPSAYVIDDLLMVQMDIELVDLLASCWGVTPEATRSAVDAFSSRYLGEFLAQAERRAGERLIQA